jgi:hypothetical protein
MNLRGPTGKLIGWSLAFLLVTGGASLFASVLDFNKDVRPILSENCFECHGPDEQARKADLRLDQALLQSTVVKPGDPASSELIQRIFAVDEGERMPPAASLRKLSEDDKNRLKQWVLEGARAERHWSFVMPQRSELPDVSSEGWVRNAIDYFVVDRLRDEGLEPSSEADLETLLRRSALDITGLPAAPDTLITALGVADGNVYERWVDQLFESPQYGEHMATSWLEASRYADTDGYQNDRYRYQHVWRDWVIMAFNQNKPYDEFVIEQLAGDLLDNATFTQQVATGFCRNHRINSEDGSIPAEWHVENVVDRVDTLGTVFLGLTLGCARCHDHKYDPISQKDYYRFFAYFNNVAEWGVGPNNGNSPPFIEVPETWPNLTAAEDRFILPEPVKLNNARKESGNGLRRPQAGGTNTVMVMHELSEPRESFLLQRGQYDMPDKSERLYPGVLSQIGTPPKEQPTNRLGLARWLVDPSHPLTARVAVNRFWQQYFGIGLVKTSENFGSQGEQPSHPELLDWLAREFVDSGWDIKGLQKLILKSATYRQRSMSRGTLIERDPENRLLARGPRYRLPAGVLRDQALSVSGLLVDQSFGPPAKPYMPAKIWRAFSNNTYKQDHGANLFRRSVYTYWRRTIPPPTMMNFNAGNRETCVVRTERTNTPLQALTMMNNVLFVESARFLAQRAMREVGDRESELINRMFLLCAGRYPAAEEFDILTRSYRNYLDRYRIDTKSAKALLEIGEGPRNSDLPLAEHAALALTASMILNLDEVLSKQ